MELVKTKTIFFDCYQTLIDIETDEDIKKENEKIGWQRVVTLLNQNYAINSSVDELLYSIDQHKAGFYSDKDKMIYHHNLSKILFEVLREDFNLSVSNGTVLEMIYEYRKISRGYLKLHHPDIPNILSLLSQKYTLSLASYTQSSFTKPELEELGIAKYFSHFIYSSDIEFRKNSPEFYKKCLDVSRTNPNDTMMIGDNYHEDIEIPKQLGIHTIWINNTDNESLIESIPVINIKEFGRLPEIVREIFIPATKDRVSPLNQ